MLKRIARRGGIAPPRSGQAIAVRPPNFFPQMAPAIAQAVFAVSGKRIRHFHSAIRI